MQYLKNVELAKLYQVSEKTIRNWIKATREGRLDLLLHREGAKFYIANTTKNETTMRALAIAGKKHQNRRFHHIVTPTQQFYDLYEPQQIFDIIANLATHREIPLQYSYFDKTINYWDRFTRRVYHEEIPNILNQTIQLLAMNQGYLDDLLRDYQQVNIIDIGVGNALPVKALLGHFLKSGKLGRYLGIDISPDMLQLARKNVYKWFGNEVEFDAEVRDITHERFSDIFTRPPFSYWGGEFVNLALFLGGTLSNFRAPADVLSTIRNSMSPPDLLVYCLKLDTPSTRRYFDFRVGAETHPLSQQERFVLELLNIDQSMYEVEQLFDQQQHSRLIRIRLKTTISIKFELGFGERWVEINKGETVVLFRYRHQDALSTINEFASSGFNVLQASQTPDHEYLLLISDLKTTR